eukprot:5359122-Karenia_brevis.AAC.1
MVQVTGWREKRKERQKLERQQFMGRVERIDKCSGRCCEKPCEKDRFIGVVEAKEEGQRMRLNFQ